MINFIGVIVDFTIAFEAGIVGVSGCFGSHDRPVARGTDTLFQGGRIDLPP